MKNTKKYLRMAVIALMAVEITSCTKEELATSGTYTTTMSFKGSSSKALDYDGTKTFAEGDQIAVVYKNTSGATVKAISTPLTAGNIAEGNKQAQFSVILTDPDNTQQVTYIYPAAMAKEDGSVNYDALYTEQDGSITTLAANFDLCTYTGSWDGSSLPSNIVLTNQLAICKFTLKEGSTYLSGTTTRLTLIHGSDIYSVSTWGNSPVFVAVKPIASGDIKLYVARGNAKALYTTPGVSHTLAAGNIYDITANMTHVAGALPGLFSVDGSSNMVYFSQGNLQATTSDGGTNWAWNFATNQYDIIGNNTANNAIDGDRTVSSNGTVDLFGWSTDATYFGIHDATATSSYSGAFVDWGANYIGNGGQTANIWRTLTKEQFFYLFNTRTASTVGGTDNARFAKAWLLGSVHGIILFPDHYKHPDGVATPTGINQTDNTSWSANTYSAEDWAKMEAAGAVFLPLAGYRSGNSITFATSSGYYWSASQYIDPFNGNVDEEYAYCVYVNNKNLNPGDNQKKRSQGYSVRLVGEQ